MNCLILSFYDFILCGCCSFPFDAGVSQGGHCGGGGGDGDGDNDGSSISGSNDSGGVSGGTRGKDR